jgi:hypothetical protein
MASTTCFFWVKFFAFWGATSLIASLFNFLWPYMIVTNTILAGVICSPILFCNQIYKAVIKKQATSINVSQVGDKQWLHENYSVYTVAYQNQFVAVYNREIIDKDPNLAMLRARVQEKGYNLRNVYIEFINPKEMEDKYDKLK